MSRSAETVAWVCFIAGILLLLAGVAIGLYLTFKKAKEDVEKKLKEASSKIDELETAAVSGSMRPESDQGAADTVKAKAADAKSKFGEIGDIIGSLPENLRFAGLLVLVGTVLMSVATVQFGGHSLF